MPTFNYPTNFELQQIEPDLVARGAAGRLGLDIMPVRNVNAGEVRWNQQDNFYGFRRYAASTAPRRACSASAQRRTATSPACSASSSTSPKRS
jgi:hypothetical protein